MQQRETAERIRAITGDDLLDEPGVLHVASVWCDAAGRCFALRIGAATPRSETDAFVLAVARARCDAIVTTGRILREEPALRHALPPAVARWREERLSKRAAPVRVVLTARSDLDLAHPALAGPEPLIVATSPAAAADLRARAAREARPIEVVPHPGPGLRELLAWLRDERGLRSICVEAGPSSTRPLYEDPLAVDELMLSQLLARSLPVGVQGGAFVDPARIEQLFSLASEHESREESGPWRFRRLLRRSGG